MRARARSRGLAAGLPAKLWQALLGHSHSAGRLRRWLFAGITLVLLALILINAPTDLGDLSEWLFSARSAGHLIVLFLGFFL